MGSEDLYWGSTQYRLLGLSIDLIAELHVQPLG